MAKKRKTNRIADILKQIANHYIFKNIVMLGIICFFICYGTLVVLRHYTHHGEALTVPDAGGLTVEEAGKLLEASKLRWQVNDSVYLAAVPPGAVVNQNPEAGSKVKEKRNIFLTINALSPEKVKMPNVVGVSLRQAQAILEAQGLHIGTKDYVPDIAANNVLKQMYKGAEIRRGTELVKGSEIDLVLGRGLSDESTNVPDLAGQTLSGVREYLAKYFLNVGVIIYDSSVSTPADTVQAFVYQQRPVSGNDATLQLGSYVDIWLTVDEAKKPVSSAENEDKP